MSKTIEVPLSLWRADISKKAKEYYINLLAYELDGKTGDGVSEKEKEELVRINALPFFKASKKQAQNLITLINKAKGNSDIVGFRLTSGREKNIKARIKEYGYETCVKVIEHITTKWKGDDFPTQYFNPETLFRQNNFDRFREEMLSKKKEEKKQDVYVTMR